MLSLSIVCFIVVASSICTASASIPLEMLSGEWVLSGVKVQKEVTNSVHRYDGVQLVASYLPGRNMLMVTNTVSGAEYGLFSVNATSFLFEKSSAHVDSPMLSGPYLFRVHPYNGLFFAEVDLRKRSWATVTFTKKATAINVSVFTNASVTTTLIERRLQTTGLLQATLLHHRTLCCNSCTSLHHTEEHHTYKTQIVK